MERFIKAYSLFLYDEYHESVENVDAELYPLLYTDVYASELYDTDSEDIIGSIQISIAVDDGLNGGAYIVTLNLDNGKTYEVTELHDSIDEISEDLETCDFDSMYTWGLTQIQTVMKED